MIEIVHKRAVANGIEVGYRKDGHLFGLCFGSAEQLAEFVAAGAKCEDEELSAALRLWRAQSAGFDEKIMERKQVTVDYSRTDPVRTETRTR